MKTNRKIFFLFSLFIASLIVIGPTQLALPQSNQTLEEKVAKLQKTVEELKEQIPKIGYINRQEALSVFPQAVEEERRKVSKLEKEMENLSTRAGQGEIGESEFNRERDLLRARLLQARIEVDLALLDKMIEARGFSEIQDRLKELKGRTGPMQKNVADLIEDIKNYGVSPQQVSKTLEEVGSQQFKSLDNVLNNLAQSKITQVTQKIAASKEFDLTIEQQNIILYRRKETIVNLTDEVIQKLKRELKPE